MFRLVLLIFCLCNAPFIGAQDAHPFAGDDYKYGIKNRKGQIIVKPIYEQAQPATNGFILMKKFKALMLIDSSNNFKPLNELKFNGSIRFDFGEINSTGLPIVARIYECHYYDLEGKLRIGLNSYQINDANSFNQGLALIKKGMKLNIIDTIGNILLPNWYNFIGSYRNGLAMVGNGRWRSWGFDGTFGYIDKAGTERIPIKLDEASDFANGIAKVSIGNFDAVIDTMGNILRKTPRANTDNMQSRLTSSRNNADKYQLMGTARTDIVKKKTIEPSNALRPWAQNQKWGFIDQQNKIVIQPKYDYVMAFVEGRAAVKLSNKWNFTDTQGNEISSEWYDDAEAYRDEIAKVRQGSQYTYIGKDGKQLFSPMFPVKNISGGRAKVEDASGQERKYAYLNEHGQLVTQWLNAAQKFVNGLAEIKREDGLYATIDTFGIIVDDWHFKVLIKTDQYDLLECNNLYTFRDLKGRLPYPWAEDYSIFPEGRIAVKKDGKWGFIDKYGKTLIPFEYDECWNYNYSVAQVRKGKKVAFIDKNGRLISTEWYDATGGFYDERAAVMKSKKWGYIDTQGKQIAKFIYTNAGNFSNGLAMVKKGSKFGYINRQGKVAIDFQFDAAGNFNASGIATVKIGKKGGVIDMKGNFSER